MPESSTRDGAPWPAAGPSRGITIVGLLITFMGGYLLGVLGKSPHAEDPLKEASVAPRVQLPVALSPARTALVRWPCDGSCSRNSRPCGGYSSSSRSDLVSTRGAPPVLRSRRTSRVSSGRFTTGSSPIRPT